MTIWKKSITIEEITRRGKGTFSEYLGLKYTSVAADKLIGELMIKECHLQPAGIMNGGVSCAIAESIASAASNYCCLPNEYCIGVDLNTNHISPAMKGDCLTIIASPFHVGKSTQVWSIEIYNQKKRRISISRLTLLTKVSSASCN